MQHLGLLFCVVMGLSVQVQAAPQFWTQYLCGSESCSDRAVSPEEVSLAVAGSSELTERLFPARVDQIKSEATQQYKPEETLRLVGEVIGDDELRAYLPQLQDTFKLDVSGSRITDAIVLEFAVKLKNSFLKVLVMDRIAFSQSSWSLLLGMLPDTLEVLSLEGNPSVGSVIAEQAKSLPRSLKELSLKFSHISTERAELLLNHGPNLERLDLQDQGFRPQAGVLVSGVAYIPQESYQPLKKLGKKRRIRVLL